MSLAILVLSGVLFCPEFNCPIQPLAAAEDDFPRVRSTNARIRQALNEGYGKSGTFRTLVDSLRGGDVIVHIEPRECTCDRARACLTFVVDGGIVRYLRAHVSLQQIQRDLIEQIAHELFHAGEVLRAKDVRSLETFARFVAGARTPGCRGRGCYETPGAKAVESTVRAELSSRHIQERPIGFRQ
jgi:hypothetical protein